MKNKSDKATQSPKTGSSSLKQNGKDQLGRKQKTNSKNTDMGNDENEDDMRMEGSDWPRANQRSGSIKNSDGNDGGRSSQMSEFERGYYEGRRAYENEMRSRQYGSSSGGQFRNDQDEGSRGGRNSRSMYGEHPESRGAEEYRGSNKRHPGIGPDNYVADVYNGATRDIRFSSEGGRRGTYTSQNEQDRYNRSGGGYDRYENTSEDDMDDHEFRNRGYQSSGQTEGFGHRDGQQQGQSWEDQDDYRDGKAPVKRGKGRYGSR
jgi:hypothetical protein